MAANRSSKPPVTVKLTDEAVTAIVDALGRFRAKDIAPDGTVHEISALDQPALVPIVARHAEIELVQRADLRSEYLAAWSRWNTSTTETAAENAARDCRVTARALTVKLGHNAQMQAAHTGLAFECSRCGASGNAHHDLTGAVFHVKCGASAAIAEGAARSKVTP